MVQPYTRHMSSSIGLTPQSQPIANREADMVVNNAGGYTFKLDDWERLHRFLIIGSEDGTYYVNEKELTEQNANCAVRCIKLDGPRVVRQAHQINIMGRAPKTDPQLFVLALCLKHGDLPTRQAALSAAPEMLRTGMHVLRLTAILDNLNGWGRLKKRLIGNWFTSRDANEVAFQILKYQSRS